MVKMSWVSLEITKKTNNINKTVSLYVEIETDEK